ncbi:MAG TPA: hypothetical protein VMN36_14735 [Verrucomicrobiales bacterium]|nr:hypothetical protein [Verrucomicrobiales bacterium]
MERVIKELFNRIGEREATLREARWQGIALWLAAAAAAVMILLAVGAGVFSWLAVLGGLALTLIIPCLIARSRSLDFTPATVAMRLEELHPELQALLRTAVEQHASSGGALTFLQERVIQEALDRALQHGWIEMVPDDKLIRAERFRRLGRHAAFGLFAALGIVGISRILAPGPAYPLPVAGAGAFGEVDVEEALDVAVDPGDVEVERGSRLPVSARFGQARPGAAALAFGPSAEELQALPLVKNLGDPVFAGVIPNVPGDLVYQVRFEDGASRFYQVKVYDLPRIEDLTALIQPPAHTGLAERLVEDAYRVHALQDSSVSYTFQLNKEVRSARLEPAEGEPLEAVRDAGNPLVYRLALTALEAVRYRVVLEDADGRTNRNPPELELIVLENKPPQITMRFPRGDSEVSPLEELRLEAEIEDDFGVLRHGITWTLGERTEEVALGGAQEEPPRQLTATHHLALEILGAQPDDLVSYSFWAEDTDRNGAVRRTDSDLYFAEVRPFERIYRERMNPAGQQAGQAQQEEELIKLQKEIISATWNLARANPDADRIRADGQTVAGAQRHAIGQAGALRGQTQDAQALEHVDAAVAAMESAAEELDRSVESGEAGPLQPALRHERLAYQELLRLRARSIEVSRSNAPAPASASSSRSRQQMQIDQMPLTQEERRYETEREARREEAAQQRAENREELQFLDRLKQLARRQETLNDRIREAQIALEMAETEEEREEVRRRLARLQEDQREIARDLNRMREDLRNPDQEREMADTRRQLDQAGEQLREADAALREGDAAAAAAAAGRAEEQLGEAEDDLRGQVASAFEQEVRDLRREAREMSTQQEELGRRLVEGTDEAMPRRERRSLSDTQEAQPGLEGLPDDMRQQRGRIAEVAESMRELSETAEVAEPLLSNRLYDAIREAKPETALEQLEQSASDVESGDMADARTSLRDATGRVDTLTRGIEEAARSILGNEEESLRFASEQLAGVLEDMQRDMPEGAGQEGQSGPDGEASAEDSPSEGNGETAGESGEPGEGSGGEENAELAENAGRGGAAESPGEGEGRSGQPGEGSGQQPGQESGEEGEDAGSDLAGNGGRQQTPGEPSQGQGRNGQGRGQQGEAGESGEEGQTGPGQGGARDAAAESEEGEGQLADAGEEEAEGEGLGQGRGQQPGEGRGEGEGQEMAEAEGGAQGQDPGQAQGQGGGQGRGQNGDGESADSGQPREDAEGGDRRGQLAGGADGGGGSRISGWGGGDEFREWRRQLGELEDVLDDERLRDPVSRARGRLRDFLVEAKRGSGLPEWDLAQSQVLGPLTELRDALDQELRFLQGGEENKLLPVDRDPVPEAFAELVERYYGSLSRDGEE